MPGWKAIAGSSLVAVTVGVLLVFFQSPEPAKSLLETMDLVQKFRSLNKTCFILGASGASGKALLKEIMQLKPFSRVVLIGRRKLEFGDEEMKGLEQRLIDFDKLDDYKEEFSGFDVGYCCLGAIRGRDGKDGFVKIEHDYVVGSAKQALDGGCRHFHVVSSGGVNENSSFLYMQTKGRTDREVSEMGFERVSIYRPAVLLADREESRPVESILKALLKPVAYLAPTLMTTPIDFLAKAMVLSTVTPDRSGAEIIDNKQIHAMAKSLSSAP